MTKEELIEVLWSWQTKLDIHYSEDEILTVKQQRELADKINEVRLDLSKDHI